MAELLIKGVRMEYTDEGVGLPVVLVHGFPLDRRMWDAAVAALRDRYRVIAPDLRGFGGSRCDEPFSMESLADDVHELLGRIDALPCALGGLSMGGYVVYAYASRYPGDLKALLFVDTKCEADTAEARQNRMKMIDTVRSGGPRAVADQMMPKLVSPAADGQVVARVRQMIEACPARTMELALLAMRDRADHRNALAAVRVPSCFIAGEADALVPHPLAQAQAAGVREPWIAVIPGAGHMAPMEQPEHVSAALGAFLGQLR